MCNIKPNIEIRGLITDEICLHCGCQAEFEVVTSTGKEYMCRAAMHLEYKNEMEQFEESEVDAMREEEETLHAGYLDALADGYFDDGRYDDDPNPYSGTYSEE
jgi:hypothetical protein